MTGNASYLTDDLARVADRIRDIYRVDEPDTFWNLEPLLMEIIASGDIPIWLNTQLRATSENPRMICRRWHYNQVILIDDGFGFYIGKAEGGFVDENVCTLPSHAFVVPFGADVMADFYSLPEGWRCDVYNEAPLTRRETVRIPAGQPFRVRANEDLVNLRADKRVYLLKLISVPMTPFIWSYDATTCKPWQMAATVDTADKLKVIFRYAADLGWREFEDAIRPYLDYPSHHVRWEAMKAMARIGDLAQTRSLLAKLAGDDHPHVRNAAEKALSKVQ